MGQWANKLPSLSSFKSAPEKERKRSAEESAETSSTHLEGPIPTQQQQATALVILGMIGAEFSYAGKAQSRPKSGEKGAKKAVGLSDLEIMDPAIARQTAKTLQAVLLERPTSKSGLYSNLRCSTVELLGRGFNLWEKYVDIPQVVMGLLDLVIQYTRTVFVNEEEDIGKRNAVKGTKFVSEVARKALNLMILFRPVTMVMTLAKEVATFLASQHVTHFPHSSLPPVQVCIAYKLVQCPYSAKLYVWYMCALYHSTTTSIEYYRGSLY